MEMLVSSIWAVLQPDVILAMALGTIFGIIVGALPGLGSILAITIALPFTFAMGQVAAISLVIAVYCSSVFGGSISAILINTPGTPQSAATCLDGYPMTRSGHADAALGWAATASLIGGLFSTVVLIFAAPRLAQVALGFGAIETFALITVALTCIIGVAQGSLIKGLLAGVFGLFLSTVGVDQMTGQARFTFDVFAMSNGFPLLPVIVGLFAFGEVFYRLGTKAVSAGESGVRVGMKIPKLKEIMLRWKTVLRSCLIGTFVGILPGTGAATASFISYAEAKRSGRYRDKLGTGEPEGIIAAEASNNGVTGGALVPTLALGIPGDPVTALMMSALIIQGIQPGVRLFSENPGLMNSTFVALIVCNILMFVAALVMAPILTRTLRVPEPLLMTAVLVLSVVGSYGASGRMFDVGVGIFFGIVGVALRFLKVPIAPIVIGLVLGPIFEESLRQGLIITDNNFLSFMSLEYPLAMILLLLAASIVLVSAFRETRKALDYKKQK